MNQNYIPSRGDLLWLEFSPQAGSEQAGCRPALCISPKEYNDKVGLGLFCPVTSQRKGYPFEVPLPNNIEIRGVILSDHLKSLDWKARKATYICSLPNKQMEEVLGKLHTLIR